MENDRTQSVMSWGSAAEPRNDTEIISHTIPRLNPITHLSYHKVNFDYLFNFLYFMYLYINIILNLNCWGILLTFTTMHHIFSTYFFFSSALTRQSTLPGCSDIKPPKFSESSPQWFLMSSSFLLTTYFKLVSASVLITKVYFVKEGTFSWPLLQK